MVIANFINKQDALVTGLNQYDYGQVLRIQGLNLPTAVEIHFGLEETGGTTTTRIGVTKDGVTDVVIPDSMLENGDTSLDYAIYAFIYLTDETSGKTVRRIKVQVKARSKPEQFDKPSDTELFHKAIKAVNQSAKEAEGWAHGREDMPERATDNAKYYAGESAKSAEEVKKVEQSVKDMVATVDGIKQQVQDVKEYAGQAKTAAENALLSEQESKKSEEASLQHRTGAETAENNAELAESNAKKSEQAVERAKQLVMQMGQEVLDNKNYVDGKVEEFGQTVTNANNSIGTKKTESLSAIKTAKTGAVGAVETAGTEQTKKVADEGTKQVKAVEDKGNEVLQSIPEDFATQMQNKLDKQQGAENKGKALVVGDDGNVAPGEVQQATGKMRKIREFVIPDDPTVEQSDIVYTMKDSGEVLQFYLNTDDNGSPLNIKRFIMTVHKPTPFAVDTYDRNNIGIRINAKIVENRKHVLWYRATNKKTNYIYAEAECICGGIKGHAYSFSDTPGYTFYSTMSELSSASIVFKENTGDVIESIALIEPSSNVDFRGAKVTIYAEEI